MTYKVMTKSTNAYQAWTTRGSYGSEAVALAAAQRLSRLMRSCGWWTAKVACCGARDGVESGGDAG